MEKKKVLVVDDEMYIGQLIKKALGNNYNVILASNGEDALNAARTEHPDLVLMDILMPKLDGYTACYQIKNDPVTKTIPVIMLTGIGHDLNRKLAEGMGANGYITKPFNPNELLNTVRQHEAGLCPAGA
jgi:two-component system alkaline phosphatase synthesis response regulator PhoP